MYDDNKCCQVVPKRRAVGSKYEGTKEKQNLQMMLWVCCVLKKNCTLWCTSTQRSIRTNKTPSQNSGQDMCSSWHVVSLQVLYSYLNYYNQWVAGPPVPFLSQLCLYTRQSTVFLRWRAMEPRKGIDNCYTFAQGHKPLDNGWFLIMAALMSRYTRQNTAYKIQLLL